MRVRKRTLITVAIALLPVGAAAQTSGSNQWIASGFVGSNFANNADPASVEFGGSIGYLLRNTFGLEFETGFTPDFDLQSNFFGLNIKPQVNTFMGNVVYAPQLGPGGRLQPFVSGGAGAISLRSGMGTQDGLPAGDVLDPDDTRFGGNIGGGLMAFSGHWGFRADVRYYRATGSYNTSPPANPDSPTPPSPSPGPGYITAATVSGASTTAATPPTVAATTSNAQTNLAAAALSGLHFWRANVGIAVRW